MTFPPRPPTLLSVDDNPDDLALLRAAVAETRIPCAVQAVADGEEAIAYLSGQGAYADRARFPFPSVILLDLQMPGRDGFGVLEWIRSQQADWRTTPTIMFTSIHADAEIERAYSLGANSFLVKPAGFHELVRMVSHLLGYWLSYNCATVR